MSDAAKKAIQDWKDMKEFVASLGYYVGGYQMGTHKYVLMKKVNGESHFVGYIKSGDNNSLEIKAQW